MEQEKALSKAKAPFQAMSSLGLEAFVEWRLSHLDEDWQEPPREWMNPRFRGSMSAKRALWYWVNLMKNRTIDERALALGVHRLDLYSEYCDNGEMKKLRAEIEAQYPDENVCKELLEQHHNAIAGIEAPKQLPMPALMIEQPAIPVEAMVA